MQGKWAEAGVPHKGWTCVGVHDLEQERQTCEMCEGQVIRYVHAMEHPEYPGTLSVGCVCAGHAYSRPIWAPIPEHLGTA